MFHHRVIFSQNFNVNKTRLAELFRDTVSNKYKLPSACSYTPIPSNEARILVPAGKQDGTLFSQKSRAEGAQAPLSLRERNGNAWDEGGMERKKNIFPFYTGHDGVCTVAAYPTLISILIEKGFSSSEEGRVVLSSASRDARLPGNHENEESIPLPSQGAQRWIDSKASARGRRSSGHAQSFLLIICLIRKRCKKIIARSSRRRGGGRIIITNGQGPSLFFRRRASLTTWRVVWKV